MPNHLFGFITDSERQAVRTYQDREERAGVADYLEQEKHRLRQLQGGCIFVVLSLFDMKECAVVSCLILLDH